MPNQLFPVFDVPGTAVEKPTARQKYLPAPLFDVEKGDFVLDGSNKVVQSSGVDAWVLWCVKTIMTQRWAHMAYSGNEGIEAEEAFREPDRAAVQSYLTRTISEALLSDPARRTQYVRDFKFQWRADAIYIECLVVGSDGDTAAITAEIPQ